MKLSEWAKKKELSYKTAWRMAKKGTFPEPLERLPTGRYIIRGGERQESKKEKSAGALYARVSSHDQKEDLNRQVQRLREYEKKHKMVINKEVREIASGMNSKRKGLLHLLRNPEVSFIIVEHRDRLTRFGFDFLAAALQASEREIIVMNNSECKDDLVQDMIDILT